MFPENKGARIRKIQITAQAVPKFRDERRAVGIFYKPAVVGNRFVKRMACEKRRLDIRNDGNAVFMEILYKVLRVGEFFAVPVKYIPLCTDRGIAR